jgi:hypothetical protein
MILRLLCIWLVFYSLLSSLILSNVKHELLNRLRSTMAANVLITKYFVQCAGIYIRPFFPYLNNVANVYCWSQTTFLRHLFGTTKLDKEKNVFWKKNGSR